MAELLLWWDNVSIPPLLPGTLLVRPFPALPFIRDHLFCGLRPVVFRSAQVEMSKIDSFLSSLFSTT